MGWLWEESARISLMSKFGSPRAIIGGGQDYGQEGMALGGWRVKIKFQKDLVRGVVE